MLEPDLKATQALGVDYMPVVFPGFSWANLMRAEHKLDQAIPNAIPRQCGRFYWRQVYNSLAGGASMLYGAMFDEVNEGTAMFKILPSAAELPVKGIPPKTRSSRWMQTAASCQVTGTCALLVRLRRPCAAAFRPRQTSRLRFQVAAEHPEVARN